MSLNPIAAANLQQQFGELRNDVDRLKGHAREWAGLPPELPLWEKRLALPSGRAVTLTKDLSAFTDPRGSLVEDSVDERRCSASFTFATNCHDREGDVVEPGGIGLTHFRANPIFLLEHGRCAYWQLPVGRAEDPVTKHLCVDINRDRAIATCFFTQGIRQIDDLWRLVAAKALNTASIGFIPTVLERLRPGQVKQPRQGTGFRHYIPQCELIEISLAVIPVNPECLRAELAGKSYSPEIRRMFADSLPETNAWARGWAGKATGMSEGNGADGGMLVADGEKPARKKRSPKKVHGLSVQAIVVPKKIAADRQEAARLVEHLGYDAGDLRETVESWIFEQFPVQEIIEGTDKVVDARHGCHLVLGRRGPKQHAGQPPGDVFPEGDPLSPSAEPTEKRLDVRRVHAALAGVNERMTRLELDVRSAQAAQFLEQIGAR